MKSHLLGRCIVCSSALSGPCTIMNFYLYSRTCPVQIDSKRGVAPREAPRGSLAKTLSRVPILEFRNVTTVSCQMPGWAQIQSGIEMAFAVPNASLLNNTRPRSIRHCSIQIHDYVPRNVFRFAQKSTWLEVKSLSTMLTFVQRRGCR